MQLGDRLSRGYGTPSVQRAWPDFEPGFSGRALDADPVGSGMHAVGQETEVARVGERFAAQDGGVRAIGARRAHQDAVLRLLVQITAEALRVAVIAAVHESRFGALLASQVDEDRVAGHLQHAALADDLTRLG